MAFRRLDIDKAISCGDDAIPRFSGPDDGAPSPNPKFDSALPIPDQMVVCPPSPPPSTDSNTARDRRDVAAELYTDRPPGAIDRVFRTGPLEHSRPRPTTPKGIPQLRNLALYPSTSPAQRSRRPDLLRNRDARDLATPRRTIGLNPHHIWTRTPARAPIRKTFPTQWNPKTMQIGRMITDHRIEEARRRPTDPNPGPQLHRRALLRNGRNWLP